MFSSLTISRYEDGTLLDRIPANWTTNLTGSFIQSPNKQFVLNLEDDGGIRLVDTMINKTGFYSNTGDGWPLAHQVGLTSDGVLYTHSLRHDNAWQTTWHSNLLQQCFSATSGQVPYLQLFDNGELKIMANGTKDPFCTLTRRPTDSMGRLAIVIAGTFRTNDKACKSHVEKVIRTWPGDGVDVFWLTYLQDAYPDATNESLINNIRDCYGDVVKDIIVMDIDLVEEPYPFTVFKGCDQGLVNHLYAELKTLWLAGRQLQKYMLASGTRYEYAMRLRPDTFFWGGVEWRQLGMNHAYKLILPQVGREHYFYCPTPQGEVTVGKSAEEIFDRISEN